MKYSRTVTLKDGRECVIRSGKVEDAEAVLDVYRLTHAQTDEMLTYPDEIKVTVLEEAAYLAEREAQEGEAELAAVIGDRIVGTAGIRPVGGYDKVKHRAGLGIGIDRAYWGLGIGRALLRACIECAEKAGYMQLELSVAAENERAAALYRSEGFTEYGRNPAGMRLRSGRLQELVLMRLVLRDETA